MVAGEVSFGLSMLLGRLPRPNDGTVAVAETRLPGITDHVSVRASHTGLLFSERAAALTAAGRFVRLLQLEPDQNGAHHQVAIVGFNDRAWTQAGLTGDRTVVEEALARLEDGVEEGTRIDLALAEGQRALTGPGRRPVNRGVLVLLTDGLPNRVPTPAPIGPQEATVLAEADRVKAAGTTVYYCYEVTNTGDVTLNLHDLTDDVLGTIFTGLAYSLAPGASVNTVAAGLSIPYVVNSTTTNTGTWTAYNAGPVNLVTATASATVDVATGNPAIELTKTVGTVAGVCATTDTITVATGTEVYYCYEVTNTGGVALNLHALSDSALAAKLDAWRAALRPCERISTGGAAPSLPSDIRPRRSRIAVHWRYRERCHRESRMYRRV